jgi:hypothetical protein
VNAIEFPAVVYKVQTLVDGGIRLTLDLPEHAIPQAALLMDCKRTEKALMVCIKEDTPVSRR